ncbi:FosX/FosE/FosI family fosfomycin resistance hydrolase [Cucumibacter marinus]|uniref:FosX/FosE/FosI family fosfomycin resistance hydrolase n=1 Tax=Cucumibacter marinus TaxID=1121252 RepID=UPI0003FA97D4|nr:FosX/FosE/FosI family fosfomycin resistance hydrolase [Cucumibacter marinus]
MSAGRAPQPSGISHITLIVRDLDRAEAWLTSVLGAERVYDSGAETFSRSPERFFVIGADRVWVAIMQGEPQGDPGYNHIAFKVDPGTLAAYRTRLETAGLEIENGRSRVQGKGDSLYFRDFDNHRYELHTGTLEERLARYAEGR